jgi:2-oxoglutarate ferredoxin oxidoreductase subunit beta
VELHDGSHLRLRKIHQDYTPTDKVLALKMLMESHERGEVLTGVFYVDTKQTDFSTLLNTVDEPLGTLSEERVRPSRAVLAEIMQDYL